MNQSEKIQRNSNDIFIIQTEDEEQFRKKFEDANINRSCTICGNNTPDLHPHPALRVIVCSDCFQTYENAIFISEKDGSDKHCRWCSKEALKYCCSYCTFMFCKDCLSRNFGTDYIDKIENNKEWKCLICDQKLLWKLRAQCAIAISEFQSDDDHDLACTSNNTSTKNNPSTSQQSSENVSNIFRSNSRQSLTSGGDSESENNDMMRRKISKECAEEASKMFDKTINKLEKFLNKTNMLFKKVKIIKSNRVFRTCQDVEIFSSEMTRFCSQMTKIIQWIDERNTYSYKKWFDVYINDNPEPSFSCSKSFQNTDNSNPQSNCSSPQPSCSNPQKTPSTHKKQINPKFKRLHLKSPIENDDETSNNSLQQLNNFLDEVKVNLTNKTTSPTESSHKTDSDTDIIELDTIVQQVINSIDGNIVIKSEQNDANQTNSVYSKNTLIIDKNSDKTISEINPVQCNVDTELQNRILTDFDEEEEIRNEIKYVKALCDKTGEFFEALDTDSPTEIPFINLDSDDSDAESVNTNDELNIEIKADSGSDFDEEIRNLSPDLQKLLNNDLSSPVRQIIAWEDISNGSSDKTIKQEQDNDFSDILTQTIKQEFDEISTQDEEEDVEYYKELEQNIEVAIKDLLDSENSDTNSFKSISISDDSDIEDNKLNVSIKQEDFNSGYITTLDLANELEKLKTLNVQDEKNLNILTGNLVECTVKLERVDLMNIKGVKRLEDGTYKVINTSCSDIDEDDDDDNDIRKLLNLKTLEARKHVLSTSTDSESSTPNNKNKIRRKKLKKKASKSNITTTDESDNDSIISDSNSIISNCFETNSDNNLPPTINEILITSDSDLSLKITDEESETETNDKKKSDKKIKNKVNQQLEDPKAKWKKDKLLTGNLTLSDSDATNDSTANALLRKQEQRGDNDIKTNSEKRTEIIVETSSSDIETLSSDTDSDDEIIYVPTVKRKHSSNSDSETTPTKKGRKNIHKVLDDSELQRETQLADLEEEKRKERISMKHKSLDAVLSQASISQEEIGLILDVDEENKTPLVSVPKSLTANLKQHQFNGIKFMWDVCFESVNQIQNTEGAGCILAHCMGLGKTMQIVILTYALLTHPITKVKHVLIVSPLSTVFNWRNEFKNVLLNAPQRLHIYDLRSVPKRVTNVLNWRRTGGVLILGYDSFAALIKKVHRQKNISEDNKNTLLEALLDPGPDLMICDEGHILKNVKTVKYKHLNRIKTKRRIILTGTPLQNNLIEYWHMVSFVKPHLLGTFKEYTNRFVNPIVNGQYEDSSPSDIHLMKKRSHVLHKKLETTVHRYEISELRQYLPNKHEHVLFIQLSTLQIKLYEIYLQKLNNSVKTKVLFENYHDLQRIWTHPSLLLKRKKKIEKKKTYDEYFEAALDPDSMKDNFEEEDWYKDQLPNDIATNINYGSKMVVLFSIIRECSLIGDKLLVFSSSLQELDLIEEFLKIEADNSNVTWTKSIDYYRMDGDVTPDLRMKYCDSFNNEQNKRAKLFLISHKVGGLGLNLVAANRVVLMDVSWNPAYDTQSVFRVYRFGQKKECYIYRLVTLGTMEELVYSRAVTKLAISCRVVDEQQIRRHFKEDDQHKLYRLNTDYLTQEAPTPLLPGDRLLAKLWGIHKPMLYNFKDHQSMLENLTHEELNEEEMKLAWEEFKKEEETEKLKATEHALAMELFKQHSFLAAPQVPGPSNIPTVPVQMNPILIPQTPQDIQRNANNRYKPPNKLPSFNQFLNPVNKSSIFRQEPNKNYTLIKNTGQISNTSHIYPDNYAVTESLDLNKNMNLIYNPASTSQMNNGSNVSNNVMRPSVLVTAPLRKILPKQLSNTQKVNIEKLARNGVELLPAKSLNTEETTANINKENQSTDANDIIEIE